MIVAAARIDGKTLTSIDSADLELPGAGHREAREAGARRPPSSGFGRVLDLFRTALGDRVQEVRESKRLTDSPAAWSTPTGA